MGWQLWMDCSLLGSGESDQTRKSEDRRHSETMAMVMLLLRVAHHSGDLFLYLTMSLPYLLHYILHDAVLPRCVARLGVVSCHVCYTHPTNS